MKILEMELENFQGLKSFRLKANGLDVSVHGDNGSGKTTLFNAFCWVLYGKPSTDEKNFTPQTVGSYGLGLNHSAEMALELEDGSTVTLKKSFHEVYKSKRGSADKAFSGYTTDYFVDGVPVQEKEYKKKLVDIYTSEDIAKLLTRYNYFLEDLPVKERRELLLDMCGETDNEAVIASDERLAKLPEILNGKTIEDFKKIAAAQKKKLNDELKTIQPRMDEAEKAKPELKTKENEKQAQMRIDSLEYRKRELEGKLAAADKTASAQIRQRIAEAEAERAEAEAAFSRNAFEAAKGRLVERNRLSFEREKLKMELSGIRIEIKDILTKVDWMKAQREELLREGQETATLKWSGSTICPTCGQALPEDQVEEKKKVFNLKRAEKLEAIQKRGQEVSNSKIGLESEKAGKLTEKALALEGRIKEIDGQYASIEDKEDEQPPAFSDSEVGRLFEQKIKALKAELDNADEAVAKNAKDITDQIALLNRDIQEARENLASISLAKKQDERLKELKAEKKRLSAEADELEHSLELCDIFNRKKAEMLTDSINGRFENLRFRLFKELQNGGIEDDCEALIPCGGELVPFKSANNASRINAGLEVIDTLAEHYRFSLPVWIDNCESVTNPRKTKSQQIRLYVSEQYKELRVNTEE